MMGTSESLVVVEEDTNNPDDKRKDFGRSRDKAQMGKNVFLFHPKKESRNAMVMDEDVKCVPLTMEIESGYERRKMGKVVFPKKEKPTEKYKEGFPKGNEKKRENFISSVEKRKAARKRYGRASKGLFFITFILGILLFVSLPLHPSTMADSNENPDGAKGDIMGRVFSGEGDGSVLGDVDVKIDELNRKTTTNPEGYFFFENLPHGAYTITARKQGFGSASVKSSSTIINLQLDSDSNLDNSVSMSEGNNYNSSYAMTLLASFSSLAAVMAVQLSKKLYPAMILGIIGIASFGYMFGSICAILGVVLLICSKIE